MRASLGYISTASYSAWANGDEMARTLADKRFLLTGATSGIGKALAKQLLELGVALAIVGRNAEKLQTLVAEFANFKGKVHPISGDVGIEADQSRIVSEAVRQLGGLDGLINNAGIASWGHFAGGTEEILRQIMEVNFHGPAELIRHAIPHLTEGREPIIVNVSSMTGRKAMPAWSEYSASKHALCGLTEALRGEMARFGIDTLLVIPGLTKTGLQKDMLRNDGKVKIDYESGMEPTYVADKIVKAIRSGKQEIVVGSDARRMLLVNRFLPRFLDRKIARKVTEAYRS